MNHLLPTLLRETIYPVFFILLGKFLSLIVVAEFYHLGYRRELFLISFSSYGDFLKANSDSSLFMLILIIGGTLWSLTRAHFLHRTHVTPALANRLANLKLSFLIQSTTTIYIQALVWLVLLYLAAVDFIFESATGLLYGYLPVIAALSAFFSTWTLLLDWDSEIAWEKEGKISTFVGNNND